MNTELARWASLPIAPEQPVILNSRVWRVTAANPGLMTGPGTNSYLLLGEDRVACVDPGPADPAHLDALLSAVSASGRPLTDILLTHTHRDHSPGSGALAARTGARIHGCPPLAEDPSQDRDTVIDQVLADGQCWTGLGWPLTVIATPGHVENHLCFLDAEQGWLLTGDHLIQGSTVVIIPPHGRLGDYLASLRKLLDQPVRALLPGHGTVIDDARTAIEGTIAHRLRREDKLLARFPVGTRCELMALVAQVYDDVPVQLHPVARFSLWAHLIKLAEEGRARETADGWQRLA